MNNPIAISIILPCYNVASYLPKCLESLMQQDFIDFETICIDDGSTDETLDVLLRMKQQFEGGGNLFI